jgi:serine/threonine protein kinase
VLKVPKPIILADPEFALRFKREIRSMVELTHPHILKIKDVGEHQGMPFYVMDLLTGGSLEDRFETGPDKQRKPMPPERLADWLESVAGALDFIHRRFVHRDIKPANILFDSHGNAFVSDFGIVKAISDGSEQKKQTVMTQAGMVIGTGPYMAPEISEGKKYDGRADQYALAATVYEALSGRVPFDGATLPAIIMQQVTGKIPPLHDLVPTLPKTLTQVIEKGLSLDPKNRYANCAAFADAVLAAAKAAPAKNSQRSSKSSPALKAVCPACKKTFPLPPDPAGKTITCPACGAGFTVAKKSPDQQSTETNRSSLAKEETRVTKKREPPLPRKAPSQSMLSGRTWLVSAALAGVSAVVLVFAIALVLGGYFLFRGDGTKRQDHGGALIDNAAKK